MDKVEELFLGLLESISCLVFFLYLGIVYLNLENYCIYNVGWIVCKNEKSKEEKFGIIILRSRGWVEDIVYKV